MADAAKNREAAERGERPARYGTRTWWQVLKRMMNESDTRNLGLISAGVAYYALLSIFPAIAALIAIWGLLADPQTIADQLGMARQLLPDAAYKIVSNQVEALVKSTDTSLQLASVISVLVALWTARNGVASLIRGLNAVYREEHRSNPLMRYVVAIGLTALLIGVALVAFAAVVMLPIIQSALTLPFKIEALIGVLKWVILLGVVFFSIGLLYRLGPNRRGARVPWVSPGAVAAVVTWALGSIAFSIYLRNFGSLNEVYGSIGAVIALLLWFYISAYVILMGALLNAELELQTTRDTTVGDPRPAGQREAHVADYTIGPSGEERLASDERFMDEKK